jgi:hypothetical protein
MGAWGSGGFENDAALDWASSVESLDDVARPLSRLTLPDGPAAGQTIDAGFASELIAAAETVAMLVGRGAPDVPRSLRERLENASEPPPALRHQARHAVCEVLRRSELAELWEETSSDCGLNAWHIAITGLIDRLNPDIAAVPWRAAEIEEQAGALAGPCAFCNEPVPADALFGLTVIDYSDRTSGQRGYWVHLACLNARLHHKFAILDLKFDPDDMPDLDQR